MDPFFFSNVQRLPQLRALLGQLDDPDDGAGVGRADRDIALPCQRARQLAVVLCPSGRLDGRSDFRDGLAVLDGGQSAVSVARLLAVAVVAGTEAGLELIFLDVKVELLVSAGDLLSTYVCSPGKLSHLLEATLVTPNPEPELLLLGAHDPRLGRDQQPTVVMQQDGERVLEARGVVLALAAHEARHPVRLAEQVHRLVEQVRAQVVDGATGGYDLGLPRRDGRLLGTVTVEVGFVLDDTAQGTVLDEFGEGDEVGVPAAVYTVEFLLAEAQQMTGNDQYAL